MIGKADKMRTIITYSDLCKIISWGGEMKKNKYVCVEVRLQ